MLQYLNKEIWNWNIRLSLLLDYFCHLLIRYISVYYRETGSKCWINLAEGEGRRLKYFRFKLHVFCDLNHLLCFRIETTVEDTEGSVSQVSGRTDIKCYKSQYHNCKSYDIMIKAEHFKSRSWHDREQNCFHLHLLILIIWYFFTLYNCACALYVSHTYLVQLYTLCSCTRLHQPPRAAGLREKNTVQHEHELSRWNRMCWGGRHV